MSGIVGSRFNTRGSGLVGSLGTDGQVFTSSGAGAGAVFEAAAGGGEWARLDTTTVSSSVSSVVIDNVFSATYQTYVLYFNGVTFNTGIHPFVQFVTGGDGTVASAANYSTKWHEQHNDFGASADASSYNTTPNGFYVTETYAQNSTDLATYGQMTFYNPYSNSFYNTVTHLWSCYDGSHFYIQRGYGAYQAKIVATGIKIQPNGANTLEAGEFVMYGIKRA